MFTCFDRLETDKRHLHTGQCPDSVPRAVSYIKTVAEPAHENKGECVQRNHVGDKSIATYVFNSASGYD